jgi:hypothetical protein
MPRVSVFTMNLLEIETVRGNDEKIAALSFTCPHERVISGTF